MEFLTTKGIAAAIEKIIRDANEFIVLISPYVNVDKTYLDRLYEAEKRGVKINLIFGKDDMRKFEKEKFQNFKNINVYFLENLHAKCYMNENIALITSMNLYGYSEANNREMGIEFNKNQNQDLYADIVNESLSIRDSAEKIELLNYKNFFYSESDNKRSVYGYCIRCGEHIELDLYRPLCDSCYQVWSQFGNTDYPENYCHKCGKEIDSWNRNHVNYAHPFCSDCENGYNLKW